MARYTPQHKAETRTRLIEAARHEFRLRGFEDTSIDRLMNAAGLTRGGFYAHFSSKEALIEEVLRIEPGLLDQLRQADDDTTRAARIEGYLAPEARGELIQCPLVSHAADVTRGGPTRQALYAEQIDAMVNTLTSGDEAGPDETCRADALALTALIVGGAVLSAAIGDGAQADELVSSVLADVRARLGTEPR